VFLDQKRSARRGVQHAFLETLPVEATRREVDKGHPSVPPKTKEDLLPCRTMSQMVWGGIRAGWIFRSIKVLLIYWGDRMVREIPRGDRMMAMVWDRSPFPLLGVDVPSCQSVLSEERRDLVIGPTTMRR